MKRNIYDMVKLHITFHEPIGNIHGESLWATPLKNGNYRLENDSIGVDLNFGDIVKAEYIDGILEFQSFVLREVNPQAD